ncbi:hypothetical protein BGZ76_000743, partial [Entomortierella beljakovae]
EEQKQGQQQKHLKVQADSQVDPQPHVDFPSDLNQSTKPDSQLEVPTHAVNTIADASHEPQSPIEQNIDENAVQAVLELNRALIRVCSDYQRTWLTLDPDFLIYRSRLQSTLTFLSSWQGITMDASSSHTASSNKPDLTPLPPARFPSAIEAMILLQKAIVALSVAQKRRAHTEPKARAEKILKTSKNDGGLSSDMLKTVHSAEEINAPHTTNAPSNPTAATSIPSLSPQIVAIASLKHQPNQQQPGNDMQPQKLPGMEKSVIVPVMPSASESPLDSQIQPHVLEIPSETRNTIITASAPMPKTPIPSSSMAISSENTKGKRLSQSKKNRSVINSLPNSPTVAQSPSLASSAPGHAGVSLIQPSSAGQHRGIRPPTKPLRISIPTSDWMAGKRFGPHSEGTQQLVQTPRILTPRPVPQHQRDHTASPISTGPSVNMVKSTPFQPGSPVPIINSQGLVAAQQRLNMPIQQSPSVSSIQSVSQTTANHSPTQHIQQHVLGISPARHSMQVYHEKLPLGRREPPPPPHSVQMKLGEHQQQQLSQLQFHMMQQQKFHPDQFQLHLQRQQQMQQQQQQQQQQLQLQQQWRNHHLMQQHQHRQNQTGQTTSIASSVQSNPFVLNPQPHSPSVSHQNNQGFTVATHETLATEPTLSNSSMAVLQTVQNESGPLKAQEQSLQWQVNQKPQQQQPQQQQHQQQHQQHQQQQQQQLSAFSDGRFDDIKQDIPVLPKNDEPSIQNSIESEFDVFDMDSIGMSGIDFNMTTSNNSLGDYGFESFNSHGQSQGAQAHQEDHEFGLSGLELEEEADDDMINGFLNL